MSAGDHRGRKGHERNRKPKVRIVPLVDYIEKRVKGLGLTSTGTIYYDDGCFNWPDIEVLGAVAPEVLESIRTFRCTVYGPSEMAEVVLPLGVTLYRIPVTMLGSWWKDSVDDLAMEVVFVVPADSTEGLRRAVEKFKSSLNHVRKLLPLTSRAS